MNRGDVGFGDATILSADPSGGFDCVMYVEPIHGRIRRGRSRRLVERVIGARAQPKA
jgi:hypothetical protein